MEIVCFTLNLGARKNIHAKQSFGDPSDLGNTNEQTGGEEEGA